jgi:hypothetical protein
MRQRSTALWESRISGVESRSPAAEAAMTRGCEILLGVFLLVGAQAIVIAALIFTIIQIARPAASEPFDWDRYYDRQDACAEKDRIAAQCEVERNPVFNSFVRRGIPEGYCDELALRQAQRACSAFDPLGRGAR